MSRSEVVQAGVQSVRPLTKSHRTQAILARIAEQGTVTLTALAKELHISEATMRRDIADLEDQGLLRRTRGGATAIDDAQRAQADQESDGDAQTSAGLIDAIARLAAQLVPEGRHVVAFSGGNISRAIALELAERAELTAITNSLSVANQISANTSIQLIMTGGGEAPRRF